MKSIDSVKILRNSYGNIPSESGYYTWWFDRDGTNIILNALNNSKLHRFQKRKINGKNYYALYFGIGADLRQRFKWHVLQRHSASAVKSGYLSTLRQSLSAILGKNMTKGGYCVDCFMDAHCWWEFTTTDNKSSAEYEEKKELNTNYYILNIKDNNVVEKKTINLLKDLRKRFKR